MDASSVDEMLDDSHVLKSEGSSSGSESASFGHSTPTCTPLRDVWLGKKQLKVLMALQLHMQTDTEEAVPSLEVKLKANLRDFPYKKCCAYLHASNAGGNLDRTTQTTNYKNTLLSWIGHVMHGGMTAEEALLRKVVSRFVRTGALRSLNQRSEELHARNAQPSSHNGDPGGDQQEHLSIRSRSPSLHDRGSLRHNGLSTTENGDTLGQNGSTTQTEDTPKQNGSITQSEHTLEHSDSTTPNEDITAQNGNRVTQHDVPLATQVPLPAPIEYARYTSRLKEFCDFHDETLVWTMSDIGTTDHPRFSYSVTLRGQTAEGTGRKKREAKHLAHFRLCQKLGITLS